MKKEKGTNVPANAGIEPYPFVKMDLQKLFNCNF
jgi:hypothetical protein